MMAIIVRMNTIIRFCLKKMMKSDIFILSVSLTNSWKYKLEKILRFSSVVNRLVSTDFYLDL